MELENTLENLIGWLKKFGTGCSIYPWQGEMNSGFSIIGPKGEDLGNFCVIKDKLFVEIA